MRGSLSLISFSISASRVMMPMVICRNRTDGFRLEIHDEGRIQRDVARRQQLLLLDRFLLRLRVFLAAQHLERGKTAAGEHQEQHDDDDQALLAALGRFGFGAFYEFIIGCGWLGHGILTRKSGCDGIDWCNARATSRSVSGVTLWRLFATGVTVFWRAANAAANQT